MKLAIGIALCASVAAAAQDYPNRPVRFVTPTAAGGGSDIHARVLAQKMSENWRQQVVVDNRPGAGSTIGTDIVARATPDGYTLLLIAVGHAINVSLYKKLPYDTLRDFLPVILLTSSPSVLVVSPKIPVASVKELITYAKARPQQLNYGSSGSGNSGHLAMELLKMMTDIDVVHVPYKGTAQAQTALLSGQELQLMFASPASVLPHVKAGRLKALGVSTGKRFPALPELPAIAETVPGYEADFWYGVVAPARTPGKIVGKLNAEFNRILALADVKERLKALGVDPLGGTPAQADKHIRSEIVKWTKVVKQSGASVD
ncbi:MAG: tripartite tricarboxylate transporter substrate binding protein [Betaproteobacteria bacterium]|nr:tripartite tricarboxylate transporter substrate binding protein [Betaproteobacteria bacterium]MBI3937679.1 tripartite tricarboxylate transporter substrate binding protein [Betaproteobacteria bacterium]